MRKSMLFLGVLGLAGLLSAADLFTGSWKMNPAKTKVTGPASAYKSGDVKFEAQGDGVNFTYDIVRADGSAIHGQYSAKYDGKDYPVTGDPETDTVALRKTDDRNLNYVYKKGGKEVSTEHVVISRDGKSATATSKGKNEKGQNYTVVTVWEKQ